MGVGAHNSGLTGQALAVTSGLIIAHISLEDLEAQASELFEAHYAELSVDTDRAVKPDWWSLRKLRTIGRLHTIGAWMSGDLIGYSVSIHVPRHLHYDFGYVMNDALYVSPDYRNGTVGGRLMSVVREWAVEQGADEVTWHAKEGTELHRKLDRARERFKLRDIIYSERV